MAILLFVEWEEGYGTFKIIILLTKTLVFLNFFSSHLTEKSSVALFVTWGIQLGFAFFALTNSGESDLIIKLYILLFAHELWHLTTGEKVS